MKKPTGSVRFYKPETEKTELNPNRKKKPEKTEPNWKKPSQNQAKPKKPSQTGLNRFRFGFVFFLKKSVWLFFFIITESNKK